MGVKDVLSGHIKEVLKINSSLSLKRIKICEKCPLYLTSEVLGPLCNNALWINPETNEVVGHPKDGFIRGCNCRLDAKTRNKDNHCIINKW